jgi:hypothetical protein
MAMKLPANLMSVKLVQLQKQGRKSQQRVERRKLNPWRTLVC